MKENPFIFLLLLPFRGLHALANFIFFDLFSSAYKRELRQQRQKRSNPNWDLVREVQHLRREIRRLHKQYDDKLKRQRNQHRKELERRERQLHRRTLERAK